MDEQPLDEMIDKAVERVCGEPGAPRTEEGVADRVLQDPDVRLLLDGYRMHDRAEGLEDVIVRDIRRKVAEALQRRTRSG
jgi:hypothetical protein